MIYTLAFIGMVMLGVLLSDVLQRANRIMKDYEQRTGLRTPLLRQQPSPYHPLNGFWDRHGDGWISRISSESR